MVGHRHALDWKLPEATAADTSSIQAEGFRGSPVQATEDSDFFNGHWFGVWGW
jgi:hypothetical protein